MANALILHGLFAEFPTQFLQGILEQNLIPSREFESRSREFGALAEIPTRARLCGARPLGWGRTGRGPRLRRWQAYSALLMMCRSRLSLGLRPRLKAQVRPRPGEWPALIGRRHKWPDPAVRIGTFPRRVVTARLSVADRVLDQFSADGAEENYLYCNPAPNGDKRHADR